MRCTSTLKRPKAAMHNMTSATHDMAKDRVPVLLLKTKSTPGDAYQDIFSQSQHGLSFDPSFVPVLEHTFDNQGMAKVESLLTSRRIGTHSGASYGGLIFTSQRAVEAFTKLVQDGQGKDYPSLAFAVHSLSHTQSCLTTGNRERYNMAASPRRASIQRGAGHD